MTTRPSVFASRTLTQRLAAVGVLVAITLAVPLYFIARGFSKDIEFTVLERYGNQYQRPLEDLLEYLPEHESLARAGGSLSQSESHIDAGLNALHEVELRLGDALQLNPEALAKRKWEHYQWSELDREWKSLKRSAAASAEKSDQAHEHLIADVRAMIEHAGDSSNLTLDSDLDSYYLMDATVVTLPQAQQRLARIEMLDAGRRLELAAAAALMREADVAKIKTDIDTSLREDPNFHGVSAELQQNLPPAEAQYQKTSEALLSVMKSV